MPYLIRRRRGGSRTEGGSGDERRVTHCFEYNTKTTSVKLSQLGRFLRMVKSSVEIETSVSSGAVADRAESCGTNGEFVKFSIWKRVYRRT